MWLSKANFSVERVLVQVFFYLDFRSQFEANGPNRCYFPFLSTSAVEIRRPKNFFELLPNL